MWILLLEYLHGNDYIDKCGYEILGFTSLLNATFVSYKELRCARQVLEIFPNSPQRPSGVSAALTPRQLWFHKETNCSSTQINWSNPHPWSASSHTHTRSLGASLPKNGIIHSLNKSNKFLLQIRDSLGIFLLTCLCSISQFRAFVIKSLLKGTNKHSCLTQCASVDIDQPIAILTQKRPCVLFGFDALQKFMCTALITLYFKQFIFK